MRKLFEEHFLLIEGILTLLGTYYTYKWLTDDTYEPIAAMVFVLLAVVSWLVKVFLPKPDPPSSDEIGQVFDERLDKRLTPIEELLKETIERFDELKNTAGEVKAPVVPIVEGVPEPKIRDNLVEDVIRMRMEIERRVETLARLQGVEPGKSNVDTVRLLKLPEVIRTSLLDFFSVANSLVHSPRPLIEWAPTAGEPIISVLDYFIRGWEGGGSTK